MASLGTQRFPMARHFPRICCILGLLFVATAAKTLANETAVPIRLVEAEGAERRLLDRFERYLDQKHWDDALDIAARLLQEKSPTVVAVGEHRFVSTREYVHQQLAKLPVDVLTDYRALVDAPAEAWTRQGIAERDSKRLQQVVDESFCSRWGDDALFALGELALEQGEHQTARRHWSRIHPELQFSDEQPVLTYPDSDFTLAEVKARLALVSLYEGNLKRAKKEIQALSANHGKAIGQLGGQQVVFAEALAQMLQQAESWQPRPTKNDWPTYAGSPARTNARSTAGKAPYKKLWSRPLGETSEARLCTFPIVLGELLVYQNASQVEALRLDTGERVFAVEGGAFQSPATNEKDFCDSLSGSDDRVFGATANSLWGIDLRRDGALCFQQQPEEENLAFAGAPIVAGERLWIALQSSGPIAHAGIACYDLATGKKIWQRQIGRANTPTTGRALATNLLTYDSGVIYSCTNLGAIAAYRADDGHPLWIATYERTSNAHADYHSPNPCLFVRGMLFVLPTDSSELFCFDAATGIMRWSQKRGSPARQILGVAGNRLLVSDEGLRTFDLQTGEPKDHKKNLQLQGRPVLLGKTVYWSTEQTIRTISEPARPRARPSQAPKKILRLPEPGGANLLAAGKYLVAAGPTQITVYQTQSPPANSPGISQIP